MFTGYRVGQKARLTKLICVDEASGYKIGDIITIIKIDNNGIYNDKRRFFYFAQLAPVFEIGDEVEIITHPFIKDIKEGKITHIGWVGLYGTDTSIWINGMEKTVKGGHWLGENQVKLIRKGEGMAKSLRDRIEALTGWDKEGDDILQEIFSQLEYSYDILFRNYTHQDVKENRGLIVIMKNAESYPDSEADFEYDSQCSKLRAFKDALLFLLDKSGLEKDTEKEEMLKQIAELRTHHEAEGQRIEELERKVGK